MTKTIKKISLITVLAVLLLSLFIGFTVSAKTVKTANAEETSEYTWQQVLLTTNNSSPFAIGDTYVLMRKLDSYEQGHVPRVMLNATELGYTLAPPFADITESIGEIYFMADDYDTSFNYHVFSLERVDATTLANINASGISDLEVLCAYYIPSSVSDSEFNKSFDLTRPVFTSCAEECFLIKKVFSHTTHTYGPWVPEVPATCAVTGTLAHKDCTVCGKHFDENGNEIANLTISTTGHTFGDYEETPSTCISTGVIVHRTCSVCNKVFNLEGNETTLAALETPVAPCDYRNFTFTAEVPATCTTNGVRAYYTCNLCGKMYDSWDETVRHQLTAESLIIPGEHTFGEWVPEVSATRTSTGIKGHIDCTVCGKHFDENMTEIQELTIPKVWTVETVGNNENVIVGNKYFIIKFLNNVDDFVFYFNSSLQIHLNSYEPQFYYRGAYHFSAISQVQLAEITTLANLGIEDFTNVYGFYLPANFLEFNLETESSSTSYQPHSGEHNVSPAVAYLIGAPDTYFVPEHTYSEWIAEKPATCIVTGTKGHYLCLDCGKYFDSEYNEIQDLTIPVDSTAHSFGEWVTEVPATCTTVGTKAHRDCTRCGKHFDTNGNEIQDLTIPALGHTFGEWEEEVPATKTEEGVKGHKDCTVCGKHFDENGAEIQDLTIPKVKTSSNGQNVGGSSSNENIKWISFAGALVLVFGVAATVAHFVKKRKK